MAETGVREPSNLTGRGGGSCDMRCHSSNSQALFSSLPPFCSFAFPRSDGSPELYFPCILFGTKIESKTHYPHK